MPKRTNKTSKKQLTDHARAMRCLELRKAGRTYQEIADELGYANESGPYKAVLRTLSAQKQEAASDVRDLELARLEDMLKAIWAAVQQGDMAAIDRVLRIQERRAKFLGLDGPIKTEEVSTPEQRMEQFTHAIRTGQEGLFSLFARAIREAPEEVRRRYADACLGTESVAGGELMGQDVTKMLGEPKE